jgi:MYXO-CTERM domain-containing protein
MIRRVLHSSLRSSAALASAVALVTALAPAEADACGGLFCSNNPVDQNAERILFEVHGNGNITATVEISFTGDPANFSWIVPVSETPSEMDVAPPSALRMLDMATSPQIISPPTTCSDPARFGFDDGAPVAAEADNAGSAPPSDPGVTVEDLPIVGPYDPEVISSEDPEALVTWLEENGYIITEEMKPFIADYVEDGFKFLGVKLTPDAGVNDISPLSFTCPAGAPLVPLRLTAIASEPEMGVLVFVAGAERYASTNFRSIEVPTDLVQMDPRTNSNNYYPLVSWLIDEEGGKAFVTEYANTTGSTTPLVDSVNLFTNDVEESRAFVSDVLGEHGYLTRVYTRMSGWEMDDDPTFAAIGGGNVSNVHDLSNRPPVEVCGGVEIEPIPCGETYCGADQRCATTEAGVDGCVCEPGFVARNITAPRGRGQALGQTVTCQDAGLDLLQSLEGTFDPCDGFSCGDNGQCVPVNGFATCECAAGFAARVDFGQPSGLQCAAIVTTHEPNALLWPGGIGTRDAAACACAGVPADQLAYSGFALLAGLGLAFRRRRRR